MMGCKMKDLKDYVRTIPDFPEPGIMFRDITTVLRDADGFKLAIDLMLECLKDVEFDVLALAESRGFIFGSVLAYELHKPITLVRKKGKLPAKTISEKYELEYGTAELEILLDAVKEGDKVVVIDDLLATGGTIEACCKLIEALGGEVADILVLMELQGLNGREKLSEYRVDSVLKYEGK